MKKPDIRHVVRHFCLECQGGSAKAVRECADAICALWPHRLPGSSAPLGVPDREDEAEHKNAPAQEKAQDSITVAGICSPSLSLGCSDGSAPSGIELVDGSMLPDTEIVDGLALSGPKAREAQRRVLLRAVRRHCLSCAASREDVRACAAREQCGLWSYRFGVRPETYRSVRERFLRPKTLSLFT